jgi:transposase
MTIARKARSRRGNLKIKYTVRLTLEERGILEKMLRSGKLGAQRRQHAQILLKVDEGQGGPGWTSERTAEAVDVSINTVGNVRRRFVEEGFEAAIHRKKQVRPSRAILIDGEKEARLIALACGKPPAGNARWTLKLLADQLVELKIVEDVSLETVRQALKKTNCNLTVASTGASRPKPAPNSSGPWKTSWRPINYRTTPRNRSFASMNDRCN